LSAFEDKLNNNPFTIIAEGEMIKYGKAITSMVLCLILSSIAMSQSSSEVVSSLRPEGYQLFENGESVSPGTSLHIFTSMTPLGDYPNYLSGKISFDYNGFISAGISHDNSFGNPLGRMILSNQLELRFQILEERGYLPAVSILYQRLINKQDVFYSGSNIWSDNHSLYGNYLAPRLYNTDNSLFSIGLSSKISKKLNLSWSLGQREFIWRQENSSQPSQTSFRIHWSADVLYKLIDDMSIHASIQSIPLLENDLSSFSIVPKVGYRSTFGIRFYLIRAVGIELYDQVRSGYSDLTSYHYIRLGFNTAFSFN
jgi:hypothetical protein